VDRITTTIKREFLAEIVAGIKTIEYREIKPYWTEKFRQISVPFELRLINGMSKTAPEVMVRIDGITKGTEWELHIGQILGYKNWPTRELAKNFDEQCAHYKRALNGRAWERCQKKSYHRGLHITALGRKWETAPDKR